MCINPNKRAATSHVEYETDAWISVFNVTLSLSRVIKVYGTAFSRAGTRELVGAIRMVLNVILGVCAMREERLDPAKFSPPEFHEVSFGPGEKKWEVVKFDVLEGWVSFHHSLHWLLAELFKHVELLGEEAVSGAMGGNVKLRDVLGVDERGVLVVVDFPLRGLFFSSSIYTKLN
jgi:E3 ubiquitin-protein ligase UBR1